MKWRLSLESAQSKERISSFWRCVRFWCCCFVFDPWMVPLELSTCSLCLNLCATWTQYLWLLSLPDLFVTLQIWSKNIKMKSINLTALKKHGKVYDGGESPALKISISFCLPVSFKLCLYLCQSQVVTTLCFAPLEQFGCLVWSHSETHLLYVAERKRPKAESFFQVCQQIVWFEG